MRSRNATASSPAPSPKSRLRSARSSSRSSCVALEVLLRVGERLRALLRESVDVPRDVLDELRDLVLRRVVGLREQRSVDLDRDRVPEDLPELRVCDLDPRRAGMKWDPIEPLTEDDDEGAARPTIACFGRRTTREYACNEQARKALHLRDATRDRAWSSFRARSCRPFARRGSSRRARRRCRPHPQPARA